MNNYAEEYFYMVPFGAAYPLLDFVNSMTDSFMLYDEHALEENHLFRFRFGDPVPKNKKMGDAHGHGQHLVVSERIKELLESMNLKNVQYLSATIEDSKKNEVFENYWTLHIFNLIKSMDREKSKFEENRKGIIKWINKLVLENEALSKVPLEERLVFALDESNLFKFFHKSVVEQILAINPEGVKFAPLPSGTPKAYLKQLIGSIF